MPRVDVLMQSGKVVQWLKKEGDIVSKGEPVAVIEAEKTTFEIEAQESGVLRKILGNAGEDISVGQTLALIGQPDDEIPERYLTAIEPAVSQPQGLVLERENLRDGQEIRASPAARSLARQHKLDLTTVKGTGRGGRIQVEDVQKALETTKTLSPDTEKSTTALKVKQKIPLAGIRKAVAERLSHSFHTAAPVMLTTEVDFEAMDDIRKKLDPAVSVTAFLVKAVALSLREHSILNSSLDSDQIIVYDDVNVAVAVDTADGLTAPVVFGSEHKNVTEISKDIEDLKEKASSGKLTIQELTSGTFTVTNLGGYGIEIFAPIINPPQAGIVAIGRASRKPVVLEESIQIRSRATMSLVFDHRIVDGVPASRFLIHVKRLLEDPSSLLGN